MQKGTMLYNAMAKYRRKFLVINLVILALLIMFVVWKMPYIKTELFGAVHVDEDRLLKETGTFDIDELIELDRHELKEPESYYYKGSSYWQDDKYLFDIDVDSIRKTGIVYTTKIEVSQNNVMEYDSSEIWIAEIGGRSFAVIGLPNKAYKKHLTGYFVSPSKAVIADLSAKLDNGEKLTLCDRFIDCRGVDMGTASTDALIMWIWAIVVLLLFIKLAAYYAKPELTPTYKQLRRYGSIDEIADEVNRQAESDEAYVDGKTLVTKDFIISDDTFKKKVVKNHMAG